MVGRTAIKARIGTASRQGEEAPVASVLQERRYNVQVRTCLLKRVTACSQNSLLLGESSSTFFGPTLQGCRCLAVYGSAA